MAQHQVAPGPRQDFPPSSPPEPAIFQMNHISQRGSQPGSGMRNHLRTSGEYRSTALPNESKAIPAGPNGHPVHGGPRNFGTLGAAGGFEGPRSPPNTKSLLSFHPVSCREKWLMIGFQTLRTCPANSSRLASVKLAKPAHFHIRLIRPSLKRRANTLQRYGRVQYKILACCGFSISCLRMLMASQGNCKFGTKCALLHILPNGRVVNRPTGSLGGHLNLGGRVDPLAYHHQESALGNSLLAQQANGHPHPPPFGHQFPSLPDAESGLPVPLHQPFDHPQPLDTGYAAHPDAKYGSPRDDTRLPMSPVMHISTLDAPLPASFDSQGISYMARHGPVAASMPSKFGLESPPSSLPKKSLLPSDAIRSLHDSAFGRESRNRTNQHLGSSPSGLLAESGGQRVMHSQRITKPKLLSASLPRPAVLDDWDNDILFGGEEDYLPSNLTHLLNAEEKTRRLSGREHDPSTLRENLNNGGTSAETFSNKVGSPGTASPSRFSALFTKQKREEESNGILNPSFGHVGSPLRNSSLHLGSSPGLRSARRTSSGDVPLYVASPPRQPSLSILSQQLQRTRLAKAESQSSEGLPTLHPISIRHPSNPGNRLDRVVSSSSIHTNRIDEEQGDCIFTLDDEDYGENRQNALWNPGFGGAKSPNLGPIGGGRHGLSTQNSNGSKGSLPIVGSLEQGQR